MTMWRLLPILLLGILLAACNRDGRDAISVGSKRTQLSLADYGMSLAVPSEWQSEQNVSGLRWYARPTLKGKVMPAAYLTLLRDEPNVLLQPGEVPTLDSYAAFKQEQESHNALTHRAISIESVSVDGVPGKLLRSEYTSKTHQWQTLSLVTIRGEWGYTLTATASKDDADSLSAAYRGVFNSWRWAPAAAVAR